MKGEQQLRKSFGEVLAAYGITDCDLVGDLLLAVKGQHLMSYLGEIRAIDEADLRDPGADNWTYEVYVEPGD